MRPQPSHLIAGLSGGYLPNTVEHYSTKTEALEALRDFIDRADWDGSLDRRGRVADGFVSLGEYEFAEVSPCPDPVTCNTEEECP